MEQELAADQLAAGGMINGRAYGRALARLALRAQCVAKVPGPVLTAEQVCIVRRITMLKQGSLKPMSRRGRWTVAVMTLTLISTMPLSGLRGKPPEDNPPADNSNKAAVDEEAKTTDPEAEKRRQEAEERRLASIEFPPCTFAGRLKWQPGKLSVPAASASLKYIQDLVAFTLLEQFPEKAELTAPATLSLSWDTRERERGLLTFGATCNQAQGMDPRFILRLITNPLFTNFSMSSETKTIAGKKATRLVAKGMNPETRAMPADDGPTHWFVQEGDEFHFGTEEQIIAQLNPSGEAKEKSQDPQRLIDVPSALAETYESAGFALVYNDCDKWQDMLTKHFQGTSKESTLEVIAPYLKDLTHIGVFLDRRQFQDGQNTLPLLVHIGYSSKETARESARNLLGLRALARTIPMEPEMAAIVHEFAEHSGIYLADNSVIVQLNQSKVADLFCQQILPQKFIGWTDILAVVQPTETPGTVTFECNHGFGSAGFLAQSIEAQKYQGKRVRVSAELGASPDTHERCGMIVWGGDKHGTTTGNATSGHSIGEPIDAKAVVEALQSRAAQDTTQWRTHTIEWDVSQSTNALSFGVYLAAGKVSVRNLKFEVVGEAQAPSETQLKSLPRNLMQIPVEPCCPSRRTWTSLSQPRLRAMHPRRDPLHGSMFRSSNH